MIGDEIEDLAAIASLAGQVHEAVLRVRGRGEAGCGTVNVEVAASGRICELVISEDGVGLRPQRLAELVSQAHRDALAEALAAAGDVRRELATDPRVARITRAIAAVPERPEPALDEPYAMRERILRDPLLRY